MGCLAVIARGAATGPAARGRSRPSAVGRVRSIIVGSTLGSPAPGSLHVDSVTAARARAHTGKSRSTPAVRARC